MSDDSLEDQLRQDAARWHAAGGTGTPDQHERVLNSALHRVRTRRLPPVTLIAAAVAAVIVIAVVGVTVQTSSNGIGPGPAGTSGTHPSPHATCASPAGQIGKREPVTPSQVRRTAYALLVAATASLTACSSSSSSTPPTRAPTSSIASRPTPPHSTTLTPHPTSSTTAKQPAAPPATKSNQPTSPPAKSSSSSSSSQSTTCITANLKLVAGKGFGAGGTGYQVYYLKNVGSGPCSIYGYPGFSTLGTSGQIVGHPAARDADLNERPDGGPQYREETLTLQPEQRAEFVVATPSCQNEKNPKHFTVAEIQVYPPNQTQPIRESAPGQGCGSSEVGYVIPAS